ncbi:Poly(Beta-D-mannuronate) lyase [Alteromonas infernus]
MKLKSTFKSAVGVVTLLTLNSTVNAEDFFVDSKASYYDAVSQVGPGDDIVFKNGTYRDFEIKFQAQGSKQAPVTLRAETKGEVVFSGQSNLAIAGSHVVVSGLVFKNGYSPSGSVISFRVNKDDVANHTRVTEVVIEDYSKPDKFESDYWVALYGKHNRFDHSYLAGKRNRGVTVAVRLDSADSTENYHQIDNNYFGYRPELGSNGGETLRIGTSHYSLENSFTRVENNVFDRCNGEVEIISVKSGGNTLHGNTFIDVSHIQLAAGADEERSAPPVDSVFTKNLVVANRVPTTFSFFDDISGITFSNNIANYSVESQIEAGFTKRTDIGESTNVTVDGMQVGADDSVKALSKDEVGPSWYQKKEYELPFKSGKEIRVEPGVNTIFDAVTQAEDGDVLVLGEGKYSEEKIIKVEKVLSIEGASSDLVTILPQRSALFEISDNGALALQSVTLAGTDAPDAAGNTLIRTKKWGMLTNYRFTMDNVKVVDVDINHSFHFFSAGARSFATHFSVTNSHFETISGNVFAFNKEKDDLGIYNVEVLNISNNVFENVSGALALIYRGGTDESTFGPKVTLSDNTLTKVGHGKRNKRKASIFLHGVQKTNIRNNTFDSSAKVRIEHTVGEPQTTLSQNSFSNTDKPSIIDFLMAKDGCQCQ